MELGPKSDESIFPIASPISASLPLPPPLYSLAGVGPFPSDVGLAGDLASVTAAGSAPDGAVLAGHPPGGHSHGLGFGEMEIALSVSLYPTQMITHPTTMVRVMCAQSSAVPHAVHGGRRRAVPSMQ